MTTYHVEKMAYIEKMGPPGGPKGGQGGQKIKYGSNCLKLPKSSRNAKKIFALSKSANTFSLCQSKATLPLLQFFLSNVNVNRICIERKVFSETNKLKEKLKSILDIKEFIPNFFCQ